MLLRVLLTAVCAAVATAAVLIVDCTYAIIDLFTDDPAGLCAGLSSFGSDSQVWIGVALGALAVFGLTVIWLPVVKAGVRQRRFEPAKALAHNLPRLADVGTQLEEVENVPTLAEIQTIRLLRKVEAVEVSVMSEAIPTREATQQWMRLLREANDLHNDGTLETDDFKKINTRLLDLFFVPKDDSGHKGATSQ
ncbi:MAG TPA: hypothetical protein VF148_11900 [Acidimicrobiia bacterium]